MSRPTPENLHVQLVPMDHEAVFAMVLYAYERVLKKGADRAILHRAVLSNTYRPDPDEINRLRTLQREVRAQGAGDSESVIDELEEQVQHEYGRDRTASALAKMELEVVCDAGVRWSVVGKRGPVVRISPQLLGLLTRLYPDDLTEEGYPAFVEGSEVPVDGSGRRLFGEDPSGMARIYRSPDDVIEAYKKLSFVDRPSLDAAINEVVGDGPEAEETATWLEADFEALTGRYESAAASRAGLHYRYS